MSSVWAMVLWTAIPVIVLLPTFTIGTYWFSGISTNGGARGNCLRNGLTMRR